MICTSINSNSLKEIEDIIKEENFCELRLDLCNLTIDEVKYIFSNYSPLIATYRRNKDLKESKRNIFLQEAIIAGADYLDIDFLNLDQKDNFLISLAKEHNCKLILSFHDYNCTPNIDKIKNYISLILKENPDIIKLAFKANSIQDTALILSLYSSFPHLANKMIAIAMGELGKISRIASPLLGAPFSYFSCLNMPATAEGQINSQEARQIFKTLS